MFDIERSHRFKLERVGRHLTSAFRAKFTIDGTSSEIRLPHASSSLTKSTDVSDWNKIDCILRETNLDFSSSFAYF